MTGSALIQASNGSALVRRNGANSWDVELTRDDGQTIPPIHIEPN